MVLKRRQVQGLRSHNTLEKLLDSDCNCKGLFGINHVIVFPFLEKKWN